MENLGNEAPQWAKNLEKRVDDLLEAQTPKEPENEPKQGKEKPKQKPNEATDQQIKDWSKTNRDGKIYGKY